MLRLFIWEQESTFKGEVYDPKPDPYQPKWRADLGPAHSQELSVTFIYYLYSRKAFKQCLIKFKTSLR